ncbi:hypothetical protein EV421DRAFT_1905262 [Armillaria borealis]|uniref:Uncharacterized protein n=1 Tax=Armillaria borealis TaxID=47425 RepID=A0AA39JDS0_9AGAR|nr:hypothetical protein EV421DRAFT_1905262 [Armillaria borealis]
MVYHAYPELMGTECLTRAVVYFSLCIGIKCLTMTIDDIIEYDIDADVEHTKNRVSKSPDAIGLRVSICVAVVRVVPHLQALDVICTHPFGLDVQHPCLHGWADLAPGGLIPYHALAAAYIGATTWTIAYEAVSTRGQSGWCEDWHQVSRHPVWQIHDPDLLRYHCRGIAYYVSVALSAFVFLKELLVMDIDKPRQCMKFFLHKPTVGNLILAGFVVDAVVHRIVEGIPL